MLLSSRISSLLKIAVVLLGAVLCASAVSAQEPLQFNVPYLCPDGTTNIVTRCQSNARGEVCFWREEKNGQLITERYNVRGQMAGWLKVCKVQSGTRAGTQAGQRGQALNPPYLREMPSVDRVLREIQGKDQAETDARQMGAFWQFKKIIGDMAGSRYYHGQLTPDEQRLINNYYAAYWRIAKPNPEYVKGNGMRGYDVAPGFREDLFSRFSMQECRAQYARVNGEYQALHEARVAAEQREFENAKARNAAAQAQMAAKENEQREMARCISSGRSGYECIGDKFKKEIAGMMGVVDPSLKKALTTVPGLYLSGIWSVGTLALIFPQDQDVVDMGCGELVRDPYKYTIVNTGTQILVKVPSQPNPVTFSFNPNGTLAGPASFALTGRVVVGERHGVRTWSDGRTEPITDLIYERRTVHCSAGTLALTGAAPKMGAVSLVTGLALLKDSEQSITGSKDFKTPPGLRLIGDYTSPTGFSAEFHRESATVGCGDAVVADSYAIQSTGSQVLVKIEDRAKPIVLTLRANGSLTGAGNVQLSGRQLTGVKQDAGSSNDQFVFASTSANCAIGTLTLAAETPSEFERGAAAARASLNPPSANPSPAPAQAQSHVPLRQPEVPAANATAVLSIASGFSREPGTPDALAGHGFILLKESFENALLKAGFRPQPGASAILSWASACQKGTPECQQGLAAARPYAVTTVKIGPAGDATFPAMPAGTYYLFGSTRYNNRPLFWDLKVGLKPGTNPVVLGQQNALNR